ncbi:luciferase family oxidoreductase group 1 [Dyadobacter jejuensis]|uniref:Luciferase-like monooxygenase n=1 Tax=Dyadobacter jejuensis TaxID=1082580 RepID=A0A316AAZ3_9BACT|nr:LLM class flavin-dependent oxidoreductase [Dyadobacter jejuensis]PWJ55006.1 luciferase family oxidoreductase group 1 [Dyadobacter jejuensis]
MMNQTTVQPIGFSVLDLASVCEGGTPADAFKESVRLAKTVEQLGFKRYWLAEHHNMESVASSATSVLIGHIAGHTSSIRVGSGGIMLPNHAPLIVAEQFGTLASLYPGRIDLGLGRAPGTDQLTAKAIRGENMHAVNNFASDIQTLQTLFSEKNKNSKVRAIPGEGLNVPIWILGSSPDSARLAASMGLPYAFASHFAPTHFRDAIRYYRQHFKPSQYLDKPYVLACVNVIAADNDAEAYRLSTSLLQLFLGMVTGKRRLLQPPVEDMDQLWDIQQEYAVNQMLTYSFVGGPQKLKKKFQEFLSTYQVDEVMATGPIYDTEARLASYAHFSRVIQELNVSYSAV